jgi:hypothetical protein
VARRPGKPVPAAATPAPRTGPVAVDLDSDAKRVARSDAALVVLVLALYA